MRDDVRNKHGALRCVVLFFHLTGSSKSPNGRRCGGVSVSFACSPRSAQVPKEFPKVVLEPREVAVEVPVLVREERPVEVPQVPLG